MYLRTLIWLLTTKGSMRNKISTNESTKEPSHRLALSPPHSKLYRITKKPEAPMAPKTNNQASQTNQRGNRPESTSSDSNQRSSRVLFCSHISCNNTVALLKYYIGGKFILPPMNFTNQGWCACKLIKRQSQFYITMTLTAMGSLRRRKISITSSVVGYTIITVMRAAYISDQPTRSAPNVIEKLVSALSSAPYHIALLT